MQRTINLPKLTYDKLVELRILCASVYGGAVELVVLALLPLVSDISFFLL